jgi:S-formylglutathione hydrolase FrmB
MGNRFLRRTLSALVGLAFLYLPSGLALAGSPLSFEVRIKPGLTPPASDGRLFVILSATNSPEPRETLGRAGSDAPQAFARDIQRFESGVAAVVDKKAVGFPVERIADLKPGTYFVQALFDCARDLRIPNAPGNLYSRVQRVHLDPAHGKTVQFQLTEQLSEESFPSGKGPIKYIKLQSKLLSEFHHRPMFLRAGVLLPPNYDGEPNRRYPLWVLIGGFGTRYSALKRMMADDSKFKKLWEGAETPRFILLQLDGAGPYGDPYYVNSANNGPYGDALTQELIPYVEANYRTLGEPRARLLSGVSTGGWVSLALQIFYPDFFNGCWSSSPDPVDFRAYELINIYEGTNAYVNEFGNERPSERSLAGDTVLTMRREVGMENFLSRGNNYVFSGGQWGSWNAVFGARGTDGSPVPLWDPATGVIDHSAAEAWKKYDLRIVLTENWGTLGPKLKAKLHIAAGEADQYFLNNAVHLLDEGLAEVTPLFSGKIFYGQGKGHGWRNISMEEMMREMLAATTAAPN